MKTFLPKFFGGIVVQTFSKHLKELSFERGITRLLDCKVEKLLSGIFVVTVVSSAIVDVTSNCLADDVLLSRDDVIIALSVKSKLVVSDESATANDILFVDSFYNY